MKIKLKSSDLKIFFSYASKIKTSALIPILEFIKLEIIDGIAYLSKSNLNSYITYSLNYDSDTAVPSRAIHIVEDVFQLDLEDSIAEIKGEYKPNTLALIEERILLAAINSDKDFIEIEITDSFIKVNSVKSVIQDGNYPKLEGESTEAIELSKEVLEAIGYAKEYIFNEGGENNFSFVHLAHNMIFASMSSIMYLKKFNYLPEALLSYECASIISKFDSLYYSQLGNYHIFSKENILLGFIKSTYNTPDFLRLIVKFETAEKLYLINRVDLVSYCNLTIASSRQLANSIFTISHPNNEEIECEYKDEKIENRIKITAKYLRSPEGISLASFQPSIVVQAIGNLPFESIEFASPQPGMYTFTSPEDSTFTGVIMGMRKN